MEKAQLRSGVQKRAVEILSRFLLEYTRQYPVCLAYDSGKDYSRYRCFYIGTGENHPYIAQHSETCLTRAEEYCICVKDDTVMIQGFDDVGVLEEKAGQLLPFAPMVRNRLTLLRLLTGGAIGTP